MDPVNRLFLASGLRQGNREQSGRTNRSSYFQEGGSWEVLRYSSASTAARCLAVKEKAYDRV
jgi:hypothetical protein